MPKIQLFSLRKLFLCVILLLGGAIVLLSCAKPLSFPNEPYIEYRNIEYYASINSNGDTIPILKVSFYFQDGDGNLGCDVKAGDCQKDLIFDLQRKVSDSIYENVVAVDDTGGVFEIKYEYHLKPIEAVTSNGALYGTMTWTMEEFADIKREYRNQIMRFNIYLFDQAGNRSNLINTEDIYL